MPNYPRKNCNAILRARSPVQASLSGHAGAAVLRALLVPPASTTTADPAAAGGASGGLPAPSSAPSPLPDLTEGGGGGASPLVGTGGVPVGPASRAIYGSTAATKTALGSTRVGCVRHGIQTMKTLGSGRKIVRDKNHRTKGLFLICTRNCQLPQGSMKIVVYLHIETAQSSSILGAIDSF